MLWWNVFVLKLVSKRLTTLYLDCNRIEDTVMKDLADALILNKVKQYHALSFFIILDYWLLDDCILVTIGSQTEELSIWPPSWEEIQ